MNKGQIQKEDYKRLFNSPNYFLSSLYLVFKKSTDLYYFAILNPINLK